LSNPRQLNGKIGGVFVEFPERCGDFYELVAFHRRPVAFESGYFRPDLNKALVQAKALVSAPALYSHRTAFRQWFCEARTSGGRVRGRRDRDHRTEASENVATPAMSFPTKWLASAFVAHNAR
jgi:hypothetical protein